MAGSPALRSPPASPTVCQLKNQWSRVSAGFSGSQAHAYKHRSGVTAPVYYARAFLSKWPQGGNDQWGRDRSQSFSTLPVAGVLWVCRLARGTSPSPHRAGRTAGSMSFQPQPAESAWLPQSYLATGQSTGTSLEGREGRRGSAGPGCGTAASHPSPWTGGFPCLAPCGPDSPNTSLQGERAPAQTRNSQLELPKAQSQGSRRMGREQRSRR